MDLRQFKTLQNLGLALAKQKKYREAIRHGEHAMMVQASANTFGSNLLQKLLADGKWGLAQETAESLLRYHPDDPQALEALEIIRHQLDPSEAPADSSE